MKLFTGKLSRWFTFKTLKQHQHTELVQDSREKFRGTLEKRESLAQRIFPRLRYIIYGLATRDYEEKWSGKARTDIVYKEEMACRKLVEHRSFKYILYIVCGGAA